MSQTATIPAALAERFTSVFGDFIASLTAAVTDAGLDPQLAATPDFRAWKHKALPLLQRQHAAAQQAIDRFHKGEPAPLLAIAEEKRSLARDLNGFPLTFAGPSHAESLDKLETVLVTAACHLCLAVGIP